MKVTKGTVIKRGRVYYWKYRIDGQVHWKSLETGAKAKARKIADALRDEYMRNPEADAQDKRNPEADAQDKRNPAVGEFWDCYHAWLQEHRRPETIKVQTVFWRQLVEFTRAKRLGDIKRADIERFKAHRKRLGKAPQSINNALKDIQERSRQKPTVARLKTNITSTVLLR